MQKYFIFTLCIIGLLLSSSSHAQVTTQQLTKDLQYLAEKLPKKHASFETFATRAKFQQKVEALTKKIPQLNQTQFRLELMKLVASLNDQSTTLPLGDQLHAFPLGTYWFSDGLYIVSASPEYIKYKGYQITKINETPIEQVWEKVRPYLSAENDYARKQRFFVTRGLLAELLLYTGVISQPNDAQFTLKATDGKTQKITIKAIGIKSFLKSVVYDQVAPTTMPANTHRQKKNYWFKYLANEEILYVQFNRLANQKDESLGKFVKRLMAFAEKNDFSKFVVDLRHGGGGSGHRARMVVNAIRNSAKINQESTLYTLIGGKTMGTCAEFTTMMELRTKTTLIGSPTGQSPNWVGDIGVLTLPNTQLKVYYSNSFWPISVREDQRKWLTPEVSVSYKAQDFAQSIDPGIQAVIQYPLSSPPFRPFNRSILKQLIGKYKLGKGRKMTIYEKNGHVFLKMRHASPRSLFAVDTELHVRGDTEFATDIKGVKLTLEMNPDTQKIKALVFDWKGTKKRVEK